MKKEILIRKISAAIETLDNVGDLQFAGCWSANELVVPGARDEYHLIAFNFLSKDAALIDKSADLRKICQVAGVRAISGLTFDGVDYVSVEVGTFDLAQELYDAAKANEKRIRAVYDNLENSRKPDRDALSAACDAVGDAVAAEDSALELLLKLEAEDENLSGIR